MKTMELIGRILFFGFLTFREIVLATIRHFIDKVGTVIKSAS